MSPRGPLSLELYLDHACPWSCLAFGATSQLAEELGLEPRWRLLPIAQAVESTAAEAAMLEARQAAEWPEVEATAQHFGRRLRRPRGRHGGQLSARATCWLREQAPELETRLHEAIFAAAFEQGRDIGDPVIVGEILAGLLPSPLEPEAIEMLPVAELRRDARAAVEAGVTAVPTLVLAGSHLLLGAEPPAVLRQAIEQLRLSAAPTRIGEIG